jgi:hypothetical protein
MVMEMPVVKVLLLGVAVVMNMMMMMAAEI